VTERRFTGKTVMLTGAAGGFGASAATEFARAGAKLALADIDDAALAKLCRTLRQNGTEVLDLPMDVRDEDAVKTTVARILNAFGHLDIAINNAGIGQPMRPLTELPVDIYENVMAVNVKSVFLGMKYQLPPMISAGSGAVLNIASAAGLVGAGHMSAYAASKHAVVGLTRSAADEVARYGIRVNALCPSFAPTPLFDDMAEDLAALKGKSADEMRGAIVTRIPMRRLATMAEVVQAMLWAVDPANSFLTGHALPIDGGLSAV